MKWDKEEIEWLEENEALIDNPNSSLEDIYSEAHCFFQDSESPVKIALSLAVLKEDYSEFILYFAHQGKEVTGANRWGWNLRFAWGDVFYNCRMYFLSPYGDIDQNNFGEAKAEVIKEILQRDYEYRDFLVKIVKGISFNELKVRL